MRKKILGMSLIVLMLIAFVADGIAQETVQYGVNLQARWRGEMDGKDMNNDTNFIYASALRSRLGFWMKQGDVKAYVQFQDPNSLKWNSSALATEVNVDIHQVFLKVEHFLVDRLTVKVGRSEMKYGDERLIGAVGWSNVGRTFEGVFTHYSMDENWVDAFYTNQGGAGNGDAENLFAGVWGHYAPMNVDAFLLHRGLVGTRPTDGSTVRTSALNTIGLYYTSPKAASLKINANLAYQFGSRRVWDGLGNDEDLTISAWLLTCQAWKVMGEMSVGGGVDLTTRDNTPNQGNFVSFDNLYYTGHKFRGHMDLFVGTAGIADVFVGIKHKPLEKLSATLALHHLQLMPETTNEQNTTLGQEIDLDMTYVLKENLNLGCGAAYFLANTDTYGSGTDNALWGYLMLSTAFNLTN